jgi:hypothetical protein
MAGDQRPVEVIGLDCKTGDHADCRWWWPVFLLIQDADEGMVRGTSAVCICWCHSEREVTRNE